MPLSKARDKQRKRQGRAKSRLERLLPPSLTSKVVQPVYRPDIDADGNPIYEV